ncbi:MAG TPA: hypothetical protein PLY47_00070 [Rhodoglobus sp.]|jgi:hypothetical protein|nr:hypothetical protein [Rhodoglobus sp.]
MARSSSRPIILAAIGGLVVVAGIAAFTVASLSGGGEAVPTPKPTTQPSFDPSDYSSDELESVYPQVIDLGLVPEPITTDPEEYITAAIAAWGTYDTTTSTTIPQWKKYLESWQNVYPLVVDLPSGEQIKFAAPEENPVTRHAPTAHRDVYVIAEGTPGQTINWTPTDWDLIKDREGRVKTEVTTISDLAPASRESEQKLGEYQATVEFTQWVTMDDGTDGEHEITTTKHGTAVVSVNCTSTTPAPDSAQQPGDCKLMDIIVQDYK